jgi:hypothetical protein
MIGHKLLNKMKNATITEPKKIHQLNRPLAFLLCFGFLALSLVEMRLAAWLSPSKHRPPPSFST